MAFKIRYIEQALRLLDDIANSDGAMGGDDIDDLCEARRLLAQTVHLEYDDETNRFTSTDSPEV